MNIILVIGFSKLDVKLEEKLSINTSSVGVMKKFENILPIKNSNGCLFTDPLKGETNR
jgi:hypothetical protein